MNINSSLDQKILSIYYEYKLYRFRFSLVINCNYHYLPAKEMSTKIVRYTTSYSGIMISRDRLDTIHPTRFPVSSPPPELPPEKIQKWNYGPITVNTSTRYLPCQECEEDIDEENHYP